MSRKYFWIAVLTLMAGWVSPAVFAEGEVTGFKPFPIYSDASSTDNHFFPSGWMGDYGDLTVDEAHQVDPHGGATAFKVSYSAKGAQGARWAGIYWQNPANNWGNVVGGYDLTGATKLTFWARGEKGGERIDKFQVGGIKGVYADSDQAAIGPVLLQSEWKKYEVNLENRDLSSLSGGFMFAMNADNNPEGFTIYLDDVRFE